MTSENSIPELRAEVADLRARLAEAEETLRAIHAGEVDALVIAGSKGDEIHLLGEGDRIYRQFIEAVSEGTATLSAGGEILSCNDCLAKTLRRPIDHVLGTAMRNHLSPEDLETFGVILAQASPESRRRKIHLKTSEGSLVPVYLSATLLHSTGAEPVFCLVLTDLEEVISAEESLRRENDRAQRYLDTVETIIVVLDSQGRITRINRKGCTIFGWSEEELLGRQWFATCLPQPDGLENVYPYFLRLMAGEPETTEYFENSIVTKSGELRLIAWHNALLRDDQGRINGTLSSGEDITERKRTEDALGESEARYRALFENSPDAILLTTPDGSIMSANPAACRMFGRTEEELRALGRAAVVDTSDPRLPKLLEERARTGRSSGELDFLRKNGSSFPCEVSSLLFSDRLGVTRSSMIIRDVTERKRAEAERERLIVAIEAAGETVMVTDAEGAIQYVNPRFETLTGYTRAEAVGKNPRFLKSGVQDDVFYRGFWETLKSGRVWQGRLVNRRKDGSLYSEETTISPIRDDTGRTVSYVAVKRDITEQLRLAEEKVKLEDQLRQAQKVEAIGRLAGGVAHDFNNMMAIILGYGEMLLGQLRPEDPARNWAEQIMEAGRRSASLTRQLLAFSRKQTLLPEVLDLNALLRNLEKMFGRLIGENIDLEFKLAAGLGRTKADPGQIEQVITNLALNARDAMLLGGKLTVETANVELDHMYALGHVSVLPGRYVMLAVTDTGCGMDKATMARLFEPFFTTKEKGKGTGLGLATAYGIVKQSGGYIWAYSEPEHGTTFKIYLPQTDDALAADVVEAGGAAPRGSGERILLVEDEASLREMCETVLVRLGYQVNAAGNGLKAVLLVQEMGLEPDLVITDVIMPVMSGAEMTERLRRDRPDLRVLYLSGYPDDTIARHGVLEPGMPFLQKPFTERALALKVREALGVKPVATRLGRSVLMIDDDEQFRELMQHFCTKRGHVFAGVDSSASALVALAKQPFDVLLVDMSIPGTSGEHILREIRAAGHATPAIVLTGDVASVDMDLLRPLGVVQALEKSSNAEPLLQAIMAAGTAGG